MHRPPSPSRPAPGVCVLVALSLLALQGCVTGRGEATEGQPELAQRATGLWQTATEALGMGDDIDGGEIEGEPFRGDPEAVAQSLAAECAEAKEAGKTDFLRPLVARLYGSGIDPATSLEALTRANCAPLAELVRELVAQGGESAVAPVVERALFLAGPGAQGLVETAASDGLRSDLGGVGRGAPGAAAADTGIAFFPVTGGRFAFPSGAGDVSSAGAETLGYGLYTFVLPGGGVAHATEADRERLAELLRVIETYTLAGAADGRAPDWGTHVFLMPVDPVRHGERLADRVSPLLAAEMRADFAAHLRYLGRPELAARLEASPGPFLVSASQPRLLPTGRGDPALRLLIDLSGLGAEYMYAVVDAYDRPVPEDSLGTADGLELIRERLLGLFGEQAGMVGAAGDQTFLLSPQAPGAAETGPAGS